MPHDLGKLVDYPGLLWRPYSALALFCVGLSLPIWGIFILTSLIFKPSRDFQTWALRAWNLWVLRIFRIRIQLSGQQNYDPKQACLVVSNHQSLMDIPAAFFAFSGHLRMVAKKELFSIPFFGQVIAHTEFIPIDRGNRSSGHEASEKIAKNIRSGLQVWVAPEGTRGDGKTLGAFKKGAFAVAISAGVPVQPILIENSWESCPKKEMLVRPGTLIRVRVLPVIPSVGYTVDSRGELCDRVRQVFVNELQAV